MAVHRKEVSQTLPKMRVGSRVGVEIRDDELFEEIRIREKAAEHEFGEGGGAGGLDGVVVGFEGFEVGFCDLAVELSFGFPGFGIRVGGYGEKGGVRDEDVGDNLEGDSLEGVVAFGEAVEEEG